MPVHDDTLKVCRNIAKAGWPTLTDCGNITQRQARTLARRSPGLQFRIDERWIDFTSWVPLMDDQPHDAKVRWNMQVWEAAQTHPGFDENARPSHKARVRARGLLQRAR